MFSYLFVLWKSNRIDNMFWFIVFSIFKCGTHLPGGVGSVKKFRLCFTENAVAAVIIAKSFVLLYCKTFRTHQKHLYFRDFSKTLG